MGQRSQRAASEGRGRCDCDWCPRVRLFVYLFCSGSLIFPLCRTGSIASRSESLDRLLQDRVVGRGVNFMAHSMGGLDCRHLISHIKPTNYTPLSLTTVGTPHRGSPFMDWCTASLSFNLRCTISEFRCRTTWASGSWRRKEESRPVSSRRCVPRRPVQVCRLMQLPKPLLPSPSLHFRPPLPHCSSPCSILPHMPIFPPHTSTPFSTPRRQMIRKSSTSVSPVESAP